MKKCSKNSPVSQAKNGRFCFFFFVSNYVHRLLPAPVWPVRQCEFFLARAEKEDVERGAAFFQMYVNCFPSEGGSVSLAEAGFDLLDRRAT